MGKSIARVEIAPPKESTKTTATTDSAEKLNAEKDTEKDNASDSEYSSLEDDDDVQGEQCKECEFIRQSKIRKRRAKLCNTFQCRRKRCID